MVVCGNDDDDKECCKYLYEIVDMSRVTITNSPGEGLASGQSEPAVGVRTQALPTPQMSMMQIVAKIWWIVEERWKRSEYMIVVYVGVRTQLPRRECVTQGHNENCVECENKNKQNKRNKTKHNLLHVKKQQ